MICEFVLKDHQASGKFMARTRPMIGETIMIDSYILVVVSVLITAEQLICTITTNDNATIAYVVAKYGKKA